MDIFKINDHVRTYPKKTNGQDWTTAQRVADILSIEDEINSAIMPDQGDLVAQKLAEELAISQSEKVDKWLKLLKESNPAQFEINRKLSFFDQTKLAK